ncbi:MAG: diaminopimelate epimerase [Myxococcota bacterium]|nr:diaminopimelate epimerase [Myxococcota bacterium]
MKLLKSHGLGNDYLVLHEGTLSGRALVRALCHRHTGPGGDGVLTEGPAGDCDYGLRIFNPDGSEAEKSGNGIRIYAQYLVDHCGAPSEFSLNTLGGVVRCQVAPDQVSVQMGRASFRPADVPVDLEVEEAIEQQISAAGEDFTFTAVGVGNPHCVVFRDEALLDATRWRRWGPILECHPLFPRRTNVQFVQVRGPQQLELRIWERGAGETSASGSSSCAAAAAAVRTGRCQPGEITLHMPGGVLKVRVDPDWSLLLRGPVQEVGWFSPSAAWLAAISA